MAHFPCCPTGIRNRRGIEFGGSEALCPAQVGAGSVTPLTLVGPNVLKVKYPSQSFLTGSVAAIDPVGATACIRAARPVECPIGAYSTLPWPVAIERTTTSPVFTPTRASTGRLPATRSFAE